MRDLMEDVASGIGWGLVIGIVLAVVLVLAALVGWHYWEVDTQCTYIVGTQVCQ